MKIPGENPNNAIYPHISDNEKTTALEILRVEHLLKLGFFCLFIVRIYLPKRTGSIGRGYFVGEIHFDKEMKISIHGRLNKSNQQNSQA